MPALTRSDIQSQVSLLIPDPNNTRWTAAQKQAQIQVSMEQFVEDTRALTDTQSFSIVSGTPTYALSTDTFDILRLTHNGLPLIRMSKFDLDSFAHLDWTQTNGTPKEYYVDTTSTNKNLTLYPNPQGGDVGTNNLVAEYVKVPPTLSSDSDQPLNSQVLLRPYLMALAYHGASYFLKSSNNPADWAKGAEYMRQYEGYVSDCKETFKSLGQSEPLRMRGGRYFKDI